VTDLSAEVGGDRPGREGSAPDAPSGDGREGREAAAAAGAGQPDDAGRPLSEADGINRVKAAAAEWQEPARAAQLLDDYVRRMRDEGQLNSGPVYSGSGPVYNVNVNGAHAENLFIAGRDLHTGKSRVRAEAAKRVRLVTAEELEFVRDVYARPAGITVAESLFQTRRMVILRGTRGGGLRTAGLWLAATYAATERVFFLSPDRLLSALRAGELEKGAAYVVPGLDAATAARIGEFALDEIEAWTADGGWLVITVSASVPLNHEIATATDLVVDEISRPDPVAVASGHARCELDRLASAEATPAEYAGRLRGWLGEDDIREWLRARPEPRLAAQAGRALARAALSDGDPRAALRPLEDPQAHVTQWFTAHPDTAKRAFMLATAVLAGSSYLAIADAAAALYDELKGFRVRHERQDFWSGLAEESWLELAQEKHATPLGPLPVEVVRFRSARIQTAVLEHAWRRVDGMRLAACGWLKSLGANGSIEIRARAGAAAGIAALWDFEYTLRNILLPWAASKSAAEREAAALALSIPANDTRFSDATWRLVLGWCDPDVTSSTELVRTAIYALGGPLGAQEPETALAALREVAEDHGWERVPDIAQSLVVLAAGGHGLAVLSALLEWTSRKPDATPLRRELRLIGLTCFLICASALSAAPGHASRPVILGPADEGLLPSAYLWGRALDTSSLRSWALELLRAWCELRDDRDEDDRYVLDLVRDIAGLDDLQRQRLEHHCYHWANDTRHPSKTAREALALLRPPAVGTKSIT
jgi:hypothetical protein